MERSTPPGYSAFGSAIGAAELPLVILGALLIART
jgi:hypothetical protein